MLSLTAEVKAGRAMELSSPVASLVPGLVDKQHFGNQSVLSAGLNALMLYPDRPFQLGTLYGYAIDPDSGERERLVISDPPDLPENFLYAKERRLVEEVKAEISQGRRCQIYAVYTQKRDIAQRLKAILSREGIRVEVLTTAIPPEAREAWYERQLKAGMQVCLAHPRLVATGLDYVEYEGLGCFFLKPVCSRFETGSSDGTVFDSHAFAAAVSPWLRGLHASHSGPEPR